MKNSDVKQAANTNQSLSQSHLLVAERSWGGSEGLGAGGTARPAQGQGRVGRNLVM